MPAGLLWPSQSYPWWGDNFIAFKTQAEMESSFFYQMSLGPTREFWTCPNLEPLGYPYPPYNQGNEWWLETGYNFLTDGLRSGGNFWGATHTESHAPQRVSDPGEWNLAHDVIHAEDQGGGMWRISEGGHLEGGGAYWRYYPDAANQVSIITTTKPAGAPQLFNDGSGRWAELSEMTKNDAWGYWVYR